MGREDMNFMALVAGEIVKALLRMAFHNSRIANMTPDQVDALYVKEKAEFLTKPPDRLVDLMEHTPTPEGQAR
jgi:hypothetical protein